MGKRFWNSVRDGSILVGMIYAGGAIWYGIDWNTQEVKKNLVMVGICVLFHLFARLVQAE